MKKKLLIGAAMFIVGLVLTTPFMPPGGPISDVAKELNKEIPESESDGSPCNGFVCPGVPWHSQVLTLVVAIFLVSAGLWLVISVFRRVRGRRDEVA